MSQDPLWISETEVVQMLDLGEANERVLEISDRFGLAVDPKARIEDVTVGQQQRVERVVLAQAVTRQLLDGALRARLDCLAHVLATYRLGCAGAMMALC